MLSTVKVKILELNKDKAVLQMPEGSKIDWPAQDLPENIQAGQEWMLILTSSRNLLNEILNVEKSQAGKTIKKK